MLRVLIVVTLMVVVVAIVYVSDLDRHRCGADQVRDPETRGCFIDHGPPLR